MQFLAVNVRIRSSDDTHEEKRVITWQKVGRGCVIVGELGYKYIVHTHTHMRTEEESDWCGNRNHMSSREESRKERRHGR